jgi:hypothetical protein
MHPHHFIVAALACAAAPLAHAQSTSNLALGGSITPAACAISIQDNGVADYGVINKVNLNPNPAANTVLPETVLATLVNCIAPTRYGLRMIDNRIDSRAGLHTQEYGLGKTVDGINVGSLRLNIGYVIDLDGAPGYFTRTDNGGATWLSSLLIVSSFPPTDTHPATIFASTTIQGSTAGPSLTTVGTYNLRFAPTIRPANQLTWTDDLTLDGSATLELVYL